mgnify:CR=1 FL=1
MDPFTQIVIKATKNLILLTSAPLPLSIVSWWPQKLKIAIKKKPSPHKYTISVYDEAFIQYEWFRAKARALVRSLYRKSNLY